MHNEETHITHGDHSLRISHDVDLGQHSTMRVGGPARLFANARCLADVQCAYRWAAKRKMPICTIGSGSNTIWSDTGYYGLVIKNGIRGLQIVSRDDRAMELQIGAGEVLDHIVDQTTKMSLTGMECLSLIPGTCGGAIIQNSGAYGQEISQILNHVEVYDTQADEAAVLHKDACNLGYRSSRFKNDEPGRFVVLGFSVSLRRDPPTRPSYPALQAILGRGASLAPAEIRSAVISIRRKKLPDPDRNPNCGSFFTNPTLSNESIITELHKAQAPLYAFGIGTYKVPAAWLIEECGLKGHADMELGFATWPGQPLVIYATCKTSCASLLRYSEIIEGAVSKKFGITLEREPVLMRAYSIS